MADHTPNENLLAETNLQILVVQGGEQPNEEEVMEVPVEISIETDQAGDSDVEFVSAESSTAEESEISIQDSLAPSAGDPVVVLDTIGSNQENDTEGNVPETNGTYDPGNTIM